MLLRCSKIVILWELSSPQDATWHIWASNGVDHMVSVEFLYHLVSNDHSWRPKWPLCKARTCWTAIFNAATVSFCILVAACFSFFLFSGFSKMAWKWKLPVPKTGANIQNLDPCGIGMKPGQVTMAFFRASFACAWRSVSHWHTVRCHHKSFP